MVTRFLSISSTSSKNSIGHVFYLFMLIFSVVTSFVLLSKEKISKNKIKSQKFSKKNNDSLKNRKKRGKRGTISRGAHREDQSELC